MRGRASAGARQAVAAAAALVLPSIRLARALHRTRTELADAQRRLVEQAQRDALTGLPNRAWVIAELSRILSRREPVALVLLDLDRFQVVNDGLGHDAGDRFLRAVSDRLRTAAPAGWDVARLGGDEFALVARGARTDEDAAGIAATALRALTEPVEVSPSVALVPVASAGVVVARHGATADTLLRDADTAMYVAKGAGGGRAQVFTSALHDAAARTHALEVDLRRALHDDALTVVYQPVVDLITGKVAGCEALVRWDHPERGPVPPSEFVAVAEQSGLVVELGDVVLQKALHDAATWPMGLRGIAPGVAVNVSVRQLLDPSLPKRVAALLHDTGVDPGRLTLEVTESALAGDMGPVVEALQALRDVGVRLAIDDFGTGHASLSYLAGFPVDVVKIDQSFVAGAARDAGSAAIVSGIVAMAEAFGLRVVAEGVEEPDQLRVLRRAGVDEAQGFLLARPLPAEEVVGVLSAAIAEEAVPLPRAPAMPASAASDLDTPQRFRLLLDAARDVTACVDLESVLERSFAALRTFVEFTGGSIQLVDGDVVRLAATDPPATPEALAASIPLGQGIGGGIALSGEPRYLPDITIVSAVTPGRRSTSTSSGVRSYYGVPLVAEGRIIGVLQVDSTEVDAFDEADRLLVLSFASVVAAALQNIRMFERELDVLQRPPG
ncbi:MAG: EAL domain-containing protein [Actinomycetes bacterium]